MAKYKRGDLTIEAANADELIKIIKAVEQVEVEVVIEQGEGLCLECGGSDVETTDRPGFVKCLDCETEFML